MMPLRPFLILYDLSTFRPYQPLQNIYKTTLCAFSSVSTYNTRFQSYLRDSDFVDLNSTHVLFLKYEKDFRK